MRARPILLAIGFVIASLFVSWVLLVLPAYAAVIAGVIGLVGVLADDEVRARVLNIVRRSLELSGYTQKSAALTVEMHEADFSKMLNGERPLNEVRMARLGVEYLRIKAFLTLEEFDLPEYARTALKVADAMFVRRTA